MKKIKYRILKKGEFIKTGDENYTQCIWVKTAFHSRDQQIVGLGKYRRQVKEVIKATVTNCQFTEED